MMARRKKKKNKTSLTGALIVEALAVIVFVALFLQARAERQQELASEAPTSAVAAWPSMLEETPFQNVLDQARTDRQLDGRSSQNTVFSAKAFLSRFANID